MHVFLTFFPINNYQLGVAHSNEVYEEAQRSNIGVKVIKKVKKFNCQKFISKHKRNFVDITHICVVIFT